MVLLLAGGGCVLKSEYDQTVAQNLTYGSRMEKIKGENKELRSQLEKSKQKASDLELRNEELSKTNQSLVEKNKELAENTLGIQKELVQTKEDRQKAEDRVKFISRTYDDFVKTLKNEIAQGQVKVGKRGELLTVNLENQILFPSGSTELQAKGKKVLKKVAKLLKKTKDKHFQVEGHTDNVRLREGARFASNWELSTARATSVVRLLIQYGVRAKKLAAVGYGPFQPITSNRNATGRKKNRRIEIVLVPPYQD